MSHIVQHRKKRKKPRSSFSYLIVGSRQVTTAWFSLIDIHTRNISWPPLPVGISRKIRVLNFRKLFPCRISPSPWSQKITVSMPIIGNNNNNNNNKSYMAQLQWLTDFSGLDRSRSSSNARFVRRNTLTKPSKSSGQKQYNCMNMILVTMLIPVFSCLTFSSNPFPKFLFFFFFFFFFFLFLFFFCS